jgi:hypothetical protein
MEGNGSILNWMGVIFSLSDSTEESVVVEGDTVVKGDDGRREMR